MLHRSVTALSLIELPLARNAIIVNGWTGRSHSVTECQVYVLCLKHVRRESSKMSKDKRIVFSESKTWSVIGTQSPHLFHTIQSEKYGCAIGGQNQHFESLIQFNDTLESPVTSLFFFFFFNFHLFNVSKSSF